MEPLRDRKWNASKHSLSELRVIWAKGQLNYRVRQMNLTLCKKGVKRLKMVQY